MVVRARLAAVLGICVLATSAAARSDDLLCLKEGAFRFALDVPGIRAPSAAAPATIGGAASLDGERTLLATAALSFDLDQPPEEDGLQPADSGDAEAAGKDADALAKALANPIANLISVPLQSNFDFGSGPDGDGFRYTLNVQPVIPFDLSEDWTLITRTIVPIIYQNADASVLTDDDETGFGDTVQSFFFSPKADGKLTWGVGPVVYWPTATEDVLGADQWGLGITGVALVVDGPWTYGALANHIWSIGETRDYDSFFIDRPQINSTFLQPFATYAAGDGWSVTAGVEATYDWEGEQWTVPLGVYGAKVFNVGGQMMSLQAGPRWYVEGPDNGPEWGFRLNFTLLFPK